MRKFILVAVLLVYHLTGVAQIRLGDVVVPYELTFGKETLKLNGVGMRKVLGFDTYSGGLYTKSKFADAASVLDADESMAIRLNIVSKKITSNRMRKIFLKGFDDAMYGNTETLDVRIDKFLKIFTADLQVNDYIDLVYTKDKNVKTYKNGEEMGEIEGRDFKYALFKIWLGDEPACKYIKKGMLGKS